MAALLNSLTKIFTVSIPHNPQRSYAPAAQRTSRENAFCSWPTFSSSLMAPVSIGLGLHQFGKETEVVATNKIRLCSRQLVATNSNRPKRLNLLPILGWHERTMVDLGLQAKWIVTKWLLWHWARNAVSYLICILYYEHDDVAAQWTKSWPLHCRRLYKQIYVEPPSSVLNMKRPAFAA